MRNFTTKVLFVAFMALVFQQEIKSQSACTLDPAWVGDGMLSADHGHQVDEMLLLPDGRLLAVCNDSWQGQVQIKCYNPDGSLDPNYGNAGTLALNIGEAVTEVNALCYLNGTVYLAGTADSMGAWQHYYAFIAATDVNGGSVTQFGQNGIVKFKTGNHNFDHISRIITDTNGDLYVGGNQWADTLFVAKLTSTGQMVTTWGTNGFTKVGSPPNDSWLSIRDLKLDQNNQLVATGKYVGNINSGLPTFQHLLVLRFTVNGALDLSFANNGIGFYNSAPGLGNEGKDIMITAENDYVIVGTYYIWNSMSSNITTTKVLNNGSIDPSFGNNGWLDDHIGTSQWNEIEVAAEHLPDGHFMLAVTRFIGYTYYFGITLLNPNGTVDSSFGNNGTVMTLIDTDNRCYVHSLELDIPQGKIYVGGYSQFCSQVCGPPYLALARFNYTFAPPIVAISEPSTNGLIVSPNPSRSGGQLHISGLAQTTLQSIELLDIAGKHLAIAFNNGGIQLPAIPKGIYFLRVTTDNSVVTKKVVIE